MAILKQIDITDLDTNTTYSNPLGAEAENIDISRDSSGDITDVEHQNTSESLNTTLSNIEDKLEGVQHNFIGTLAEWNALTDAEKAEYDTYDIIDEFNTLPVDDALSSVSTNPVQNKVIKSALDKTYNTDDTTSSTINDTDYIPMSESGGTKKKTLWSTVASKIKNALTKSDVGLGNVENLDQSSAIKNITRSGTTFTATRLDDTTFTFTQQDNTGSDTKVTEYSTTTDSDYRVLLSYYADDDNDTTYVRKNTNFTYNPSTKKLIAPNLQSNIIQTSGEIQLTAGDSQNDSGDLVFYYNNGQEKARLWTANNYTTAQGLNFRTYKSDGTQLINTTLPLQDTTTGDKLKLGATKIGTVNSAITGSIGAGISLDRCIEDLLDNDMTLRDATFGVKNTWIPYLYDYETYLRTLTTLVEANYWTIGKLVIANFYCTNTNLSGINTMLQIRNVPMYQVIGGSIYIAAATSAGKTWTIQQAVGSVFIRPNVVSSQFSTPSNVGIMSGLLVGYNQ